MKREAIFSTLEAFQKAECVEIKTRAKKGQPKYKKNKINNMVFFPVPRESVARLFLRVSIQVRQGLQSGAVQFESQQQPCTGAARCK